MTSYVWNATCNNTDCVQCGQSYRLVDATNPTTCGSCYQDIEPIKTDEVWVSVSEVAE